MPGPTPFPFFHRILIFLFAGGIVAIGGQELSHRTGGFSGLSSLLPKISATQSGAESTALPASDGPAGNSISSWDEQPVSDDTRAQYSTRTERRAEPQAQPVSPASPSVAKRPREIKEVDGSTDSLERSDRKDLDTLIDKVAK